ncbi:hypothetical protein L226DRAFT_112853 [Lentinus tigrinus ALCF2SS1-7]|uniref:uncharacterized protein n=1 Tax=Lentinus tigrinus ALCF2SS1-7 TaxID=1328758 RepID=UPI001165D8C8|nr:hypothetical protein L226DRAFT_112853 [Lentinus tigrinus ALCF2SS1-7]
MPHRPHRNTPGRMPAGVPRASAPLTRHPPVVCGVSSGDGSSVRSLAYPNLALTGRHVYVRPCTRMGAVSAGTDNPCLCRSTGIGSYIDVFDHRPATAASASCPLTPLCCPRRTRRQTPHPASRIPHPDPCQSGVMVARLIRAYLPRLTARYRPCRPHWRHRTLTPAPGTEPCRDSHLEGR